MGKFAISCPSCGSYVTAYNGLRGLIHNQITCENCNHTIDVKSNRMINVVCPNCKNSVMYDQGKKVPKSPVCNHEIAPAARKKMIQIHCPTCHAKYLFKKKNTKIAFEQTKRKIENYEQELKNELDKAWQEALGIQYDGVALTPTLAEYQFDYVEGTVGIK